jgi:glyoxylase-like metal-dependent hydrolase (beta-lactamase superfamily II)
MLGNRHFNYFLVGQNESVIVECGVTGGVASLKSQWPDLQTRAEKVKKLLVMHAHFDHVCGIPELLRIFPEAQVLGSSEAGRILSKPKIINNFFYQDDKMSDILVNEGILNEKPETPAVNSLEINEHIGEGDVIDIDGILKLKVLDAPGHSPCGVACYLPTDKVMFLSDAGGFQISDTMVFPVFFQSYEMYIETIKRLMSFPTDVLGIPHEKIWVKDEIQVFYNRALQSAKEAFNSIRKMLDDGLDDNEIKKKLFARYYQGDLQIYTPDNISICVGLLLRRVKESL